jgi:hypothetical protein
VTEVRKRSNETWLKIDYGQLHISIHVAKTGLFCAFENSPRENCGAEATGCVETLRNMRRPYVPRLFMRNASNNLEYTQKHWRAP